MRCPPSSRNSAETIDWAKSISVLGSSHLDERTVERTLGTVIKYREDAERVRASGLADLVSGALKYGT